MTDLERSYAERRAAVLLAGKEIRKLNFGCVGQPWADQFPITPSIIGKGRSNALPESFPGCRCSRIQSARTRLAFPLSASLPITVHLPEMEISPGEKLGPYEIVATL